MHSTYEELLKLKRNIINWYPFKENSKILEIWEGEEKNQGEIEQEQQTAKELNSQTMQYDYVVIIGLGNKTINELLDISCKKLKEEGILIIAVDNSLGITNFCTENANQANKISRTLLETALENNGLKNKKFYYPMPNYKATNVIFTDEFLPNFETIGRSIPLYDENVEIALEEISRFNTIIEEDKKLFKIFANSYLVEATKGDLEENNISFISYSNIRKPEYRIRTMIKGDEVYKTNNTEESKNHIENLKQNINILNNCKINTVDTYNEDYIISKYQNTNFLLDNVILNKLKEGNFKEALDIIYSFQNELQEKLQPIEEPEKEPNCFDKHNIEYKKEEIENLHFIKYGLWDLIFQNCFYINNEFCFFDQEWYEENIPVEFIIYRAIKYFNKISTYIEKNDLYEKINLNNSQIELFDKLDNELQEEIRDEKIWKIMTSKEARRMLIKLNHLEQENIHLNALVTQYTDRIKNLEDGMNEAIETIKKQNEAITEIQNQLNLIVNSKSWKLTKPLRGVGRIIKGDKTKKE